MPCLGVSTYTVTIKAASTAQTVDDQFHMATSTRAAVCRSTCLVTEGRRPILLMLLLAVAGLRPPGIPGNLWSLKFPAGIPANF